MNPLHEVRDLEKLATLTESIEEKGWQGVPLVIWGVYGQLLTGSHRFAAARALEWDYTEIPTIDIEMVFAEAGLDFEAALVEEGNPSFDQWDFARVLDKLPEEIIEKYGIDWH